ncbi:MAG: hypothetical protein C0613_12070 [Desulfobulbaceae bacterium]|nr:MAG: hypothetical protein C0613_12070 [Desulfobulbaceae bacterium]
MGLPASGKSRLARRWARKHDFSYFNFDKVQKQFFGIAESARGGGHDSLPSEQSVPDMNRRTYDALLAYARQELMAGRTVVLDAVYGARQERNYLLELAVELKVTPYFVLCYCSERATKARMDDRTSAGRPGYAAHWHLFKKQQEELDPLDDLEPTMVVSVNTENPTEQLLEQLDYAFEKRDPVTVVMK